MPQMGESIFEGTITKWLKKAGDAVEKDEPLFEISTDKVDAEIPSPAGRHPHRNQGSRGRNRSGQYGRRRHRRDFQRQGSGSLCLLVALYHHCTGPFDSNGGEAAVGPTAGGAVARTEVPVRSSPLVRRIAKEHNVDLASGPGHRLQRPHHQRRHPPLPQSSPRPQKRQHVTRTAGAGAAPLPGAGRAADQDARHHRRSAWWRASASARTRTSVYKVDMTRIARLRERERAGFEQRHGVKLTFMPFIAAAAVEALRKFPIRQRLAGRAVTSTTTPTSISASPWRWSGD